jgi:hypothetical protein
MSQSGLFRLGAWVLMLCGILIVLKKGLLELLLPLNVPTSALGTLAIVSGLFGLTALYLYQRETLGRWGGIAFVINWFGLALASGADYARNWIFPYLDQSILQKLLQGPTLLALVSSGLVFLFGVILFGAAMMRAGVFPRLPVVLYIVGFVPYSLGPVFPDPVSRVAEVVAALGIIWFGFSLWAKTRNETTTKLHRVEQSTASS